MDTHAATRANALLEQKVSLPVLECSLKATHLEFACNLRMVITGADMAWQLDGRAIGRDQVIEVEAGAVLSGSYAIDGLRSYIAFDRQMKSMDGEQISLGKQRVKLAKKEEDVGGREVAGGMLEEMGVVREMGVGMELGVGKGLGVGVGLGGNELEVFRGMEWNLLSQEGKENMINYNGSLTQDMDTMGAYLQGPPIQLKVPFPRKSVCTFPGVIQLLPNGQLIVLLQDAQTTGGYPRIAYIKKESLNIFNQLKPGQKLSWNLIL